MKANTLLGLLGGALALADQRTGFYNNPEPLIPSTEGASTEELEARWGTDVRSLAFDSDAERRLLIYIYII